MEQESMKPCPLCGGEVRIHRRTDGQVDGIECDECGWSDVHEWYDPMPEYCPNCGAKVIQC